MKLGLVVGIAATLALAPSAAPAGQVSTSTDESLAWPSGAPDLRQPCACVSPGQPGFVTGLVWQGDRKLSVAEIAALLAPVLWFSPDEPLLLEGQGPLPHPHPCDPDKRRPVAYYQIQRIRLTDHGQVTLPEEADPAFWDKVASLTLRYYFYYPEDRGAGGHTHDIEVAELEVALETTVEGCRRLILRRATGFAHGLDWYSNTLDIEPDTRFPLTLLVEEGKHASCPDRNADGVYTPGYDVNRRVNDAWGVRDAFGSGFLGASGFHASMAKPREFALRVGPPAMALGCSSLRNSSFARDARLLARYDLRPANEVPACAEDGSGEDGLADLMNRNRFGSAYEPRQSSSWALSDLAEPLAYTQSWFPPIAVRRDRAWGMGFTLPPLDLGQFGYLAPRVNWIFENSDVSIEAMLTPSASRYFSWYVSTGAAYEHRVIDVGVFGRRPWGPLHWGFVGEVGVKLRARVSGRWRIASLGYHFAGVRVGIRNSGFDDFKSSRLIFEIGAGIF